MDENSVADRLSSKEKKNSYSQVKGVGMSSEDQNASIVKLLQMPGV